MVVWLSFLNLFLEATDKHRYTDPKLKKKKQKPWRALFLGTRSCFSVTETYCAIRPCETGKAVSPWELQQHTLQVGFLYPRAVAEHCFWSPPAVPKLNCGLSRGTEGWEGLLCPWFQEYLWTTTTAPKIYDDINVLNPTFWEVNGLAEQMDVTRCDGNAVLLAGR